MQERSQELLRVFGFNQTILDLTTSSQEAYCRDFYAYLEYAGSKEAALQPLTLARWIVHLKRLHYKTSTINRMVNEIQQLFSAAAVKGHIDQSIAAAFHIESKKPERPASSKTPDGVMPHITFSQTFKKCGKLACSVCRDGKGHGPYWFANWREDGKGHSIYIGRTKNEHTITQARREIEKRRGSKPVALVQATHNVQQDELISLGPTLCQLVLLRKELAGRILFAIREAVLHINEQRVELPYRLLHADTIPELHFDPQSNPCGTVEERVVILDCTLWDKRSWVLAHQDRYSPETMRRAQKGVDAYSDERNTRFVQFHGPPEHLLWFGDLVERGLLRVLLPQLARDEESRRRDQVARTLGFPRGCHSRRPGLLDTGDRWFSENAQGRELIFEPEALYRGVLYGAALVILSLEGGLTVSELLQISADRWVVETAGGMHSDWGETGPSGLIHLQSLVPDGASAQDERRLYPISQEAKGLLDEISTALEHTHGKIPVVHAFRQTKQKVLGPERYLFQWQEGAVGTKELTMLKRFVLHGLTWPNGERLRIGAQLPESHTVPTAQDDRELERLRDSLLAPLAHGLSPSSLQSYQRHLLAYVQFAGSEEQVFQPETLKRWIAHLSQKCGPVTIAQKVALVRKSIVAAGPRGLLDEGRAKAFEQIRVGRVGVAGSAGEL